MNKIYNFLETTVQTRTAAEPVEVIASQERHTPVETPCMASLQRTASPVHVETRFIASPPRTAFLRIIAFLVLCCTLLTISAQTITPGANPKVMRYQNATFTVDVENLSGSAVNDLTLEAVPMYSGTPSAEFVVTPSEITGINIAAGATYPATFTVQAKCGAPQDGAMISYILKDNSDAVIATGNAYAISISDPSFIFTPAAAVVADFASATKEYTRVWAIQQTTANSVNNLRVINTCDKTNINITKIELVNDILGTTVLDGTMAGVLDITQSGKYYYNIGASVLTQIGNADAWFGNGETIYIRETYKILTCNDANSTYTYGHGDGTNFCVGTAQSVISASVVAPGYSPDIETINMGSNTYVTFPTSASNVGTMNFILSNNSADAKSVFYDAKVAVCVATGSTMSSTPSTNYAFTRVYFVNASGVEIVGAPTLTMTNNTAVGDITSSPYRWVVSFDNFNNPALATTYQTLGLSDMTGDGIWNDIAAGSKVYIGVEWKFIPPTPATPGECVSSNLIIGSTTRHASLWYKNSCNQYQGYERAYTNIANSQGPSTCNFFSLQQYGPPGTITITPENLTPLQTAELRIDEVMTGGSNFGWLINQDNYDQYIIVTLPEGFDYNDALQGVRINALALCALADVIRTEVGGRVVLTIHNRVTVAAVSNYYRITIFAKSDISPNALKTLDIQHGWNWKDDPASGMTKYGCHSNQPVNYKLIVPYQNMTLTSFEAQRMTFGWNTYQMTQRITLSNIGSYPNVNRSAAGPFDNVDMTGTIEIESGFSVGSDRWLVDVNYKTGTNDYFSFPNPAQAAIIVVNNVPIIDIPLSNLVVLSTNIGGSDNQRTIRIDLTDYPQLAGLANGDVVKVILKTQTTQQLPNTLTQLQDFTMQTYLQSGIDPNKNILTKNFFIVDYAASFSGGGFNNAAIFNANNSETAYFSGGFCGHVSNPTVISSSEIFTGEFRPNYTLNSTSWTYNTLIDITQVQTIEYFVGEGVGNRTTNLTSGDYTVTHSAGKTTVTVNRELNAERNSGDMYHVISRGIFYCTNDINYAVEAHATFYPTSENPTNKVYNATNMNAFTGGKNEYAYALTTAAPDIYPPTNHAAWAITLTNQSLWAATDGKLPHSWISVTLPPEVDPTTIVLSDGGAINKTYADFLSYGSGKYWVQLGELNITSAKNFTLSCTYTACNDFNIPVSYGMSRAAYPQNPDIGFVNGNGSFCGLKANLALHAHVKQVELRGEVITPTPDGVITPSRYLFCEFHTFKAIFSNVQEGVLVDPVLRVRVAKGVELNHATITAVQNTTVPADLLSFITVVGDDLNTAHERMVEIKLLGVTLQPYGTAGGGNEIEITFDLKATCGFTSGSTVDMVFVATGCQELKESHSSAPIRIDGAELESTYDIAIGTFAVTGALNFSNATVAGTSALNLKAVVELVSPDQQYGVSHVLSDFIALSLPPHLTPASVAPNMLVFTFVEMEAGQALWYAEMPILMQNETCAVDVMLTPDSDYDEWSCDDVNISIYTGAVIGGECDAVICTMTEKNCDERSALVPVVKTDVSFKTGSIVATGKYHSATEESATINGTLIVPKDTDMDDLLIEFYSEKSDDFVAGASILISNVQVTGTDTEFDFSATNIIIPAADMCDLSLVIRKTATQNQYICEDTDIQLADIGFEMAVDKYDDCPDANIVVGDAYAITGYSYEWTPTTYIVGSATGTPITVKYPSSVSGNQTLNVTVNRGGCSTQTSVVVNIHALPDATLVLPSPAPSICQGENITPAWIEGMLDYDPSLVNVNVYTNAACTLKFTALFAASISPGTHSFYVLVEDKTTHCETAVSDAAILTVTVNPLPDAADVLPAGDPAICDGESITPAWIDGKLIYNPADVTVTIYEDAACTTEFTSSITANITDGYYEFYILVEDNATRCKTRAADAEMLTVTVNALPDATLILPSAAQTICDGASITPTWINSLLTYTPADVSVEIYTNAACTAEFTTAFNANIADGSYTFYILVEDNTTLCKTAVADAGALTVTVNSSPDATLILPTAAQTICDGASITPTWINSLLTYTPADVSVEIYEDAACTAAFTTAFNANIADGSYTFYILVEDNATLCKTAVSDAGALTVTVNASPDATLVLPTTPTAICHGESITPTWINSLLTYTPADVSVEIYTNAACTAAFTTAFNANIADGSYTFYILVEDNTTLCKTAVSDAGTLTVTVNALPDATLVLPTIAQTICDGEDITPTWIESLLTYNSTLVSVKVYTNAACTAEFTADITANILNIEYNFYIIVENNTTHCKTAVADAGILTIAVDDCHCKDLVAPPSVVSPQKFCNTAQVKDLQAQGIGIVWYDFNGDPTTPSDPLNTGVYYAAQTTTGGCESEWSPVMVIITPAAFLDPPNVPSEVELCVPATLADVPTDGNTNIKWYDQAAGGSEVDPTTINFTAGNTYYYYAGLVAGSCQSAWRAEVIITIGTTVDAPEMEQNQEFCLEALVANLITPNNKIVWYFEEADIIPLDADVKLVTHTYWAAQLAGGCESTDRTPVNVVIGKYPEPFAPSPQATCGKTVHISELFVIGAGIKWYTTLSGATEITSPETTVAVPGTTYWAAQTAGTCESDRVAVEITADCYSPYGTIFPFVHTGIATFDSQFVTTAKLYMAPPSTALDKIGYIRKQTPIQETIVEYYDCTAHPSIIGAPKNPGAMGATDNPGLPIRWNTIGMIPGVPNGAKLTATDKCTSAPIGKYTFNNVTPGIYVLEISRQGFLTRYGLITVTGSDYLGHRELLAGDVNGDLVVNEKDLSAITPKISVYGTANYAWRYDFDGDWRINNPDITLIRINLNALITIYEETDQWVNH